MRLKKVGYFVIHSNSTGEERFVSYSEYKDWSQERKTSLKNAVNEGSFRLMCGCCATEELSLAITSNLVIRVSNNMQQALHMDSCPKSVCYAGFVSGEGRNGMAATEDTDFLFHISFPNLTKSSSSRSTGSEGSGTGVPREKKTSIADLAIHLNRIAWEKQTFSIKKKIKEAHLAGETPSWEYKNLAEFNRLVYGVSNDIYVKCEGSVLPFSLLFYNPALFYQDANYSRQWFIYAVIEKITEYKASRKFQYVTVLMPSRASKTRSTIRIMTDTYIKLFGEPGTPEDTAGNDGSAKILAGYIMRRTYRNEDGSVSDWMNLTKGVVLTVNSHGLYAPTPAACQVAEWLCSKHILFKSPYLPLENYGSQIPNFEIERKNGKNILIDCPKEGEYEDRAGFATDNEEFDCIIACKAEEVYTALPALCPWIK